MESASFDTSRLKQAHSQAVNEVKLQVKHWKNVKNDYENLSNLLSTLPDKTTHNIMVPFGSIAFIPGKLIHTNELMVHLGDTWFADVTCKQGLKIIGHRLKTIDNNLSDLDKVLKNIEKKTEFTEELENAGEEPKIEIKEDIPSDYLHPSRRKRVSRVKSDSSKPSPSNKAPDSTTSEAMHSCFNDEELMRRLDELEKQEEEEDRLLLTDSVSDLDNPKFSNSSSKSKHLNSKPSKKVSWKQQLIEGGDAVSDDSDDAVPTPLIINFRHTPIDKVKSSDNKDTELHPGSIGRTELNKQFSEQNQSCDSAGDADTMSTSKSQPISDEPKSILKSSTSSSSRLAEISPTIQQAAVADTVLERNPVSSKVEEKSLPTKKVSKFKASRRK